MTNASVSSGRVLVFDSGVGGLTVAQALRDAEPGLVVDYAQDTGFFPYGDKSDEALRARLPVVARALVGAANPDVFVIACNTASTLALEEVRAALDVPVVGTVPAIKPAASLSQSGTIGLLATPGTIRRAYTDKLIAEFAAETRIIKHGSVDLVRLAERHAAGEAVSQEEVAAAQAPLFEADGGEAIDTVVLACTHFPLLRGALIETAPRHVTYIDSGEAIARQILRVLPENEGSADSAPRAWVTSAIDEDALTLKTLTRFGYPVPTVVAVDQPAEPLAAGRNGTTSPEAA